ncbi:MAG TPA: tryptophan synthase subunit alpha [Blastocatellia bacterium]|nr:tryptophan synthase subunit alpha [Blastocatellia bacterium]
MSGITAKFETLAKEGRKAFIPYLVAGDPDLETTQRLILEMARRGADIIELGVPFSDPMADGPVIQRAGERALKTSLGVRDCLALARRVREESDIPIVLFSYLNPLLAVGLDRLPDELASAGIDAVLGTDLVPEEADEFTRKFSSAGIDTIFLVAPTSTDERIKRAATAGSGFIYAVSRKGVTGIRQTVSDSAAALAARVKRCTTLPVAVGFGISTPEHVAEVWGYADAAVVGSRIVAEIEKWTGSQDLVERVGELTAWLVSQRKPATPAAG